MIFLSNMKKFYKDFILLNVQKNKIIYHKIFTHQTTIITINISITFKNLNHQ